ncbi:MAG TPA: matrixin family metalloprotease [Polyangia bacterium]|jgi:hypothetical protein|nr:matrixin family metalloprotease [Polyangia bacterium]
MRLARIFLLATFAASVAPEASARTELLRTDSGAEVHWVNTDITIGLDASAPSQSVAPEGVREALQAAVEAWNGVAELPARFRVVAAPDPAVRVRFCRGKWTGDLDDLGKAVFTADIRTGVVASATVEINECDRRFLAPDEAEDGRFDLQAVLTHELGHVLGLAHSDDPNALMFPRGGTAGIRTPKADDRAGVALVYGPGPAASGRKLQPADQIPTPSSERVPIERAVRASDKMPPAQVVTAMRVAGSDGTAMVVYTCEPTLLPPVSLVESDPDQRQAPRRSPGRRRHAHPAGHEPR